MAPTALTPGNPLPISTVIIIVHFMAILIIFIIIIFIWQFVTLNYTQHRIQFADILRIEKEKKKKMIYHRYHRVKDKKY